MQIRLGAWIWPVVALLAVPVAQAVVVPLGDSGWEASFVPPPDGVLEIEVLDNGGGEASQGGRGDLVIRITKEFTLPPDPDTGVFPSVVIVFRQIADDADTSRRIVIDEEWITNRTGVAWTDYHYALLLGGGTAFDADASSNFSIDPFDPVQSGFSNDFRQFELQGGVVPDGGLFTPGVDSGALVIDADLSRDRPQVFVFKQFPTPEPATWVLLVGTAGVWAVRRRIW